MPSGVSVNTYCNKQNCSTVSNSQVFFVLFYLRWIQRQIKMICRLISCDSRVPNQSLEVGESLVVGRNPKCKIKNLHCSRSHCVVELKDCKLCVKYSKTNSIELIKSGDFLKGPGFVYKVKIMGPQVLQPGKCLLTLKSIDEFVFHREWWLTWSDLVRAWFWKSVAWKLPKWWSA